MDNENKTEQEIETELEEIEREMEKVGDRYRAKMNNLHKARVDLIDLLPQDEFEDLEVSK